MSYIERRRSDRRSANERRVMEDRRYYGSSAANILREFEPPQERSGEDRRSYHRRLLADRRHS